jgi:hypothetical protein
MTPAPATMAVLHLNGILNLLAVLFNIKYTKFVSQEIA